MIPHTAAAVTTFLSLLLTATALPAQTAPDSSPAPVGVSKVRIVRLSEVKGVVQVDRNNGGQFEDAMANLPIVEQTRLRTATGVAEVEFEDNSTLRLAPGSMVEFPQLDRLATGATESSVHLLRGTAYVSLVKTRGNAFTLLFGQQKVTLPPSSHIRLQMEGAEAKLAVLDGTVHVDGPFGAMDVPKKKTVTFALQSEAQPQVAKNVAQEPFDAWDQTATGYHARTAAASAFGSTPYAYGLTDMMYYGNFMNAGSCGMMWRPYFASAAWDPYSNGAWAWYPGAGYSWVSPYPWGWTPYHYGSWAYCSGAGWGWQPGGSWLGLNNTAALMPRATLGSSPVPPRRPPLRGEPTLTAVNLKPLVVSDLASANSFQFRRDSAGMGIPRDSLGRLNKLSRETVQRGTASTPIYLSVPAAAVANGRISTAGMTASMVHRGYAMPAPSASASSHGGFSGMNGGGRVSGSTASVSAGSGHAAAGAGHGH